MREIKRGIPFPKAPYGHELPLPSDMVDSYQNVVLYLEVLWLSLRGLPKDDWIAIQGDVVGSFFELLTEKQREWLEGDDPFWKKPRAVLVKERAIQLHQRGEGQEILGQGENREIVDTIQTLIKSAWEKLKTKT